MMSKQENISAEASAFTVKAIQKIMEKPVGYAEPSIVLWNAEQIEWNLFASFIWKHHQAMGKMLLTYFNYDNGFIGVFPDSGWSYSVICT